MKNKLFFLCFAVLITSATVKSQNTIALSTAPSHSWQIGNTVNTTTPTWNTQYQTAASVQVPRKLDNASIYLTNYSMLSLMFRFTNVDDNTQYDFYPVADFPISGTTVYVGSVPYGVYNVEIGDYGPSPINKNGKTECDLTYNVHGEPLFWWNLDLGQCSSFTVVKALP